MQNDIKNLVKLSKYAGERFDLIQAGGGNSSVKFNNGTMAIKTSGIRLSEIEEHFGYTIINNKKLEQIFNNNIKNLQKKERESLAKKLVTEATLTPENKPSIETTIHLLLNKFTLHTHPITVSAITCKQNWQETLQKMFSQEKKLFVHYQTPGIDLAQELHKQLQTYMKEHAQIPSIIFLQNHGLIVTAQTHTEAKRLTDYVVIKLEKHLTTDFSNYRLTNKLSQLVNTCCNDNLITYLCTDITTCNVIAHNKALLLNKPFCPDTLVYCGYKIVEITNINNTQNINSYKNEYNEHPKVLLYNNMLFFVAKNIRKAKEIEEQFKFHLLALRIAKQTVKTNFLSNQEQHYLANWDAEKLRQTL